MSVLVPSKRLSFFSPGAKLAVPAIGYLFQIFGFEWDVVVHVAEGRESFWSVPHLFVYFGTGLVLFSGVLPIVSKQKSVSAGAYLVAASAGLQIIMAPVDDLWHRLFGIDNTLWSPPHLAFFLGGVGATLGVIMQCGSTPRARQFGVNDDGLSWDLKGLVTDPRLLLFALILCGFDLALLEFELRLPAFLWPYSFSLYPPLMIASGLLAGVAGLVYTRGAGAITMVCLAFTVLQMAVGLELRLFGYSLVLPLVPLLLPSAIAADLLVAGLTQVPFVPRLLLASLVFGAMFYAVQYPYTAYLARPAWPISVLSEGWILAALLAPSGALAGLLLGERLRQ